MQKLYLTNKSVNAALCTTEALEIIIDDVADVTVLEDIRSAKTLRVAREILLRNIAQFRTALEKLSSFYRGRCRKQAISLIDPFSLKRPL